MNRLLTIAEFWYGEGIRRRVFEPLLADFDNEVRSNRSLFTRLRWSFAVVTTFVACAPRATFSALPLSLIYDLTARAFAFGAAALAVQWASYVMASTHPAHVSPVSIEMCLPFVIFPVIWRIRAAAIPHPQKRLLAITIALLCTTIIAAAVSTWPLRAGYAVACSLLTIFGWLAGDAVRQQRSEFWDNLWMRIFKIQAVIALSAWPVKFALDVRFTTGFWPGYLVVPYVLATLIALFTKHPHRAKAADIR